MEASKERKGEDEALMRRLDIVYFLNRKGKIEQPHLIRVQHPNNNGVHLRDFKRWLSKHRGRETAESFSWSYKRIYKTGYIWQDLTEDDPIIPISDCEFILMGSLLFSPIKIRDKLKEKEEKEKEKEEGKLLTTSSTLESSFETFQIKDNISSKPFAEVDKKSPIETTTSTSSSNSKKDEMKNKILKIDSWREEMKMIEKQRHEEIIPEGIGQQHNEISSNFERAKKKKVTFKIDVSMEEMKRINRQRNEEIVATENERQFNEVKIKKSVDNGASKWVSVLRQFLRCRMVEKDSIIKEKLEDRRNQKRKEGRRKSFFFYSHALTCH